MKRVFRLTLVLLIGGFMVVSCRKKIERDVLRLDEVGVLHCINNFFDADELGTDCGGSCQPCLQIEPPCQLNDDEITVLSTFNVQTFSFNSNKTVVVDTVVGSYTYTAYTNSTDYLELKFESKPDISRTYKDSDFDVYDGIVSVLYSSNTSTDVNMFGELFVNHENGQYTFSSCNADFYHPWNGSSIATNQSFKVIFN